MAFRLSRKRTIPLKFAGTVFAASLIGAASPGAAPVWAGSSCSYQRAYSVDSGKVERHGDTLTIEVWGQAPADGWTEPKLALIPDDTNGVAVAYRLIGCAPAQESGGLHPLHARAFLISNPGRIRSIIVRAATNDVRLQDAAQY